MLFRNIPIRKKLMRIFFLTSGLMILVTCVTFFVYEFYAFRNSTVTHLSTIGKIIATNSTAALAFDNHKDANEMLSALKTEPHIAAACLYDSKGKLFARYPAVLGDNAFPVGPGVSYRFVNTHLEGFQPVIQDNRQLGTLYLKSDLGDMYERLQLYGVIVIAVITVSIFLAYLLSRVLQKSISKPILSLYETTKRISEEGDYSQRAITFGKDELGLLTDAFNHMLARIQEQNTELHEFNQTLEQKVTDRTSELESVNQELESFSYSISHDLRAPLRAIIGFTAILEEDYCNQLDDEARRITSVIKNNTGKMGMLIDDLLAFSRMSRQSIVKTNVNSDQMVQEIIEELHNKNNPGNIEWHVHTLPDMQGDTNTIRQVWINLISNAIKYSGTVAKPVIEIGSFIKADQIVFFVKDNGVGFDQKYASKLFKVFQRLHSQDEFEGTGVGLAIIDKIISKHDGKVWAESEVNKGATFFFSVPL
jgi:signal transduction histidine kinase